MNALTKPESAALNAPAFIVHYSAQGTDEWKLARAGVITASMFSVAREKLKSGPNKGKPTEAAKNYAFRLAIERISGEPLDEGFETWQMKRGHELEPMARAAHEQHAQVTVDTCGFVTTPDAVFGASADGLVGADGGAEYKCLVSPERLRDTLILNDISDFFDQLQGGMWITGRTWWDFCIYCPALAPIGRELCRWRVPRNDEYIATMEKELVEFSQLVDEFESSLRAQNQLLAA
ncbi:YqaJ viral recombinase family protein [Diaphorobacter sp. HDW4B]|uniref:lambda exonuclease family protein n=1 Tax=Diaphorobacter sp. HDW4B TaxID=2714925 RepID=UPI00140D699F|nr:lambda exonuclease family protein [Diaphorobacter sp. HDW4B]QIL72902.1 YqaJ viral recombinase family protein [Diaphorobacter sp. HDW4B]